MNVVNVGNVINLGNVVNVGNGVRSCALDSAGRGKYNKFTKFLKY
jgi:hypothetical protein